MTQEKQEFDGVFKFSNWTNEDFVVLWNNKEYTFPKNTRSPMIIQGETPENIQEIRKKFAYKLAEREWYKGADYKRMSKMGGGLPPTRDDSVLEPLVQKCLEPLPVSSAKVKDGAKENRTFKGTKAITEKTDLNKEFQEDNEVLLNQK